jgi:DNA repair protein RadC
MNELVRQIMPLYRGRDREALALILLNDENEFIGASIVATGSRDCVLIQPGEVFKLAAHANAASILVAHNHPSGDLTPSPEDLSATRILSEMGEMLGTPLLDHIILGEGTWRSLRESGNIYRTGATYAKDTAPA